MSELKNLIKNLRQYSLCLTEIGQKIINYVIQSCTDDEVVSWLKPLPHQTQFVNLLYFFTKRLNQLPDHLKKYRGGHIDIVIVAHGEITKVLMPARLLVPTPTIIDTILYSPWNCLIDANAACAIAEGWNNTEGREFYNLNPSQPVLFQPNPLPDHWNHMRRSFYSVPEILLTPVYPKEPVWEMFQGLQGHMDRDGRVIIPYLVPKDCVEAFGKMPFFMFIIALSYILMLNEKKATVHLAACLGGGSEPLQDHCRAQYAYTNDKVSMTVRNRDSFRIFSLFRAFWAMFNRKGR